MQDAGRPDYQAHDVTPDFRRAGLAIGNLTGGMAHDFNKLLSVAIGNLLQNQLRSNPEAFALNDRALQASERGAGDPA